MHGWDGDAIVEIFRAANKTPFLIMETPAHTNTLMSVPRLLLSIVIHQVFSCLMPIWSPSSHYSVCSCYNSVYSLSTLNCNCLPSTRCQASVASIGLTLEALFWKLSNT